jgi:hypothetical protein
MAEDAEHAAFLAQLIVVEGVRRQLVHFRILHVPAAPASDRP